MKNIIFNELRNFQEGDDHESIGNVREFLGQLGYITPGAPLEGLSTFDDDLSEAVRKYQLFHGLDPTGIIDETTRQMMEMPRCGVADLDEGRMVHDPGVSSFVASGGAWPSEQPLTYKFVNGTDDLPGESERDLIRQAFQVWADVTPLTFTEVTGSADATFLISWVTGDHGDGSSFDGPGHVLAHAFFPPPINPHPGIAGDIHFDDAEIWSTTHGGGNIDLLTVGIHELGHALGLRHSNVPDAIMFPTYSGIKRELAGDDIQGIQSIYPLPPEPEPEPEPEPAPSLLALIISWLRKLFGLD